MMIREFTVTGNPRGKDRPRFSTFHGIARTYSTRATVEYEKDVKSAYLHSYSYKEPLTGAIVAEIDAYFLIPKSTPKKNISVMLYENKVTKSGKIRYVGITEPLRNVIDNIPRRTWRGIFICCNETVT